MRIFLDANVLFSASNLGSNIASLIELAVSEHVVLTCTLAQEEARRNILLKRPQWSDAFEKLQEPIQCVTTTLFELPVELVEKDRPILCSAIQAGCDLLATGDKRDFGHLYEQTVQGVTIVSLVGLANRIVATDLGGA